MEGTLVPCGHFESTRPVVCAAGLIEAEIDQLYIVVKWAACGVRIRVEIGQKTKLLD